MPESYRSAKEYIHALPMDRKETFVKLLNSVRKNIPADFKEQIQYGMIGFVVPHSLYPSGYHTDTKEPLPFAHLASQKHHIALYHMGLYSDKELLNWFKKVYTKRVNDKLDMGKSCIRFRKFDAVPYDLIGELMTKITVKDWIKKYEKSIKK